MGGGRGSIWVMTSLQKVLEHIGAWYAEHVPAIHATLRPGASDAELDALEQHTGLTLPEAFRTLYRWHNGQHWRDRGMFGLSFMALEQVVNYWDIWADINLTLPEMNDEISSISHPEGTIVPRYCSPYWLGFLSMGPDFIGLDFNPDVEGVQGQIITFGRNEERKYVLAPSLDSFLREYWARLESDRVSVIRPYEHSPQQSVLLHDSRGQYMSGYRVMADFFPSFGAAPTILDPDIWL